MAATNSWHENKNFAVISLNNFFSISPEIPMNFAVSSSNTFHLIKRWMIKYDVRNIILTAILSKFACARFNMRKKSVILPRFRTISALDYVENCNP